MCKWFNFVFSSSHTNVSSLGISIIVVCVNSGGLYLKSHMEELISLSLNFHSLLLFLLCFNLNLAAFSFPFKDDSSAESDSSDLGVWPSEEAFLIKPQ